VIRTVAREAALPLRAPPMAIAPPNVGWPSSNASAAVRKYFDFTPTHSNGPLNTARWLGRMLEKSVRSVLDAFVTTE